MSPLPSTNIAIISLPLYFSYKKVVSICRRSLQYLNALIDASNVKNTRKIEDALSLSHQQLIVYVTTQFLSPTLILQSRQPS
ncbi:hypothetical protein Scep_006662 [Stephania cephalantha]|uniref:Uncharacterized protein n=1 Tax=Stephania cephalantha TaxID=152367 RepID=A0AAP0K9L8_9MAGN